jgi:imidazolonepropionase-like amidohydrolase
MGELLIQDARVLHPETGTYETGVDVHVRGDTIVAVGAHLEAPTDAQRIPVHGRTLMPGLIDAHVHVMAAVSDHHQLAAMPPYLVAAHAHRELGAMLRRGFTTVRDAGGADGGLAQAVADGLFAGPRIFPSGLALGQTAGMGDFRRRSEHSQGCPTCRSRRTISRVVDGPDAVRKACREEIADGATQIKVMASGGLSGRTPVDMSHLSVAELEAAVDEATRHGTYVMAHAYAPEPIRRAIEAGVRTIEHGNLIDAPTAARMAELGTYFVPTLTTYQASILHAHDHGTAPALVAGTQAVLDAGVAALRLCREHGVRLGFGTDLEGDVRVHQLDELEIRAQVETPAEILHSMLTVNAEILGCPQTIGRIAPGAAADLLVVDGDPLADLGVFREDGANIRVTLTRGQITKFEVPATA